MSKLNTNDNKNNNNDNNSDENNNERKPLLLNSSNFKSNDNNTNAGCFISNNNNRDKKTATSAEAEAIQKLADDVAIARNTRAKQSLIVAIFFCIVFMIVEFTFGFIAHSLAIITDGAHMLTDVGSLALSLFAVIASQWQSSEQFTFGFKRAEVVGALFSVMLVWGLVGAIIYEGITRLITITKCAERSEDQFTECEATEPKIMLIIGCLGLVVNIGYAIILAWGGAEVKHAHSHGGDDDDDDDDDHGDHHGHSHGGGHGHSHGTGVSKVKCCAPSPQEASCTDESHKHPWSNAPTPIHSAKETNKNNNSCCDHTNNNEEQQHSKSEDHSHSHSHSVNSEHHGHSHSHQEPEQEHGYSSVDNNNNNASSEAKSYSHSHSHDSHHDGHHGHAHHHGHHHGEHDDHDEEDEDPVNLNIRGAAVHALGDCLQSIGVIIAASVIWGGAGVHGDKRSYYNVADPICSLLFAVITLWTTKSLFVEVFGILMERSPKGVHQSCIIKKLEHLSGVMKVDYCNIWCISNDRFALASCLYVKPGATAEEIFDAIAQAKALCATLGFAVTTIEVLAGEKLLEDEDAEDYSPESSSLTSPNNKNSNAAAATTTTTVVPIANDDEIEE